MPEYVVLIYQDEKAMADGGQPLFYELLQGHIRFGQDNQQHIRGSHALQPTFTATCVRLDADGDDAVTSGPFVHSGPALSGYYVIETDDLDAAISLAKHVPATHGGVEVRPVMVFE